MSRLIIFCAGAASAVVSELFWKGQSRPSVALWGGVGMLLLRRVVLRFPFESRALLCILGALLLAALRLTFLILPYLSRSARKTNAPALIVDLPSFSYGLYRFLLIAPAYAVIEYLEACFGMRR